MIVWKLYDHPDPNAPYRRSGWALAETKADALAMTDCPTALAFGYTTKVWPGSPGTNLIWDFEQARP